MKGLSRAGLRALMLILCWVAPAAALAPGDLLLVKDSTLFHYELATQTLRVLSSPDVGEGPVFSEAADVAVLGSGRIAVAADSVYLVDPITGDRTQLTEPFGARRIDSLRDGRILASGTGILLYDVDPSSGEVIEIKAATFTLSDISATPDQKVLLLSGQVVREYDPATGDSPVVARTNGDEPDLRDAAGIVASFDDTAYIARPMRLARLLIGSPEPDIELVASLFNDPGTGPLWDSDTAGVSLDPQRRPLVVGRRLNGQLAWFVVDPITLVRTAVDFPATTVEGLSFPAPDGFTAVPADDDGDGVGDDVFDVCPGVFDPGQEDRDGNGVGDACNEAEDGDGDDFADTFDNCPVTPNDQADTDGDGVGDACNDAVDLDGDDYADTLDNCPELPNDQTDSDDDGLGDVCDPFPDEPDNEKGQLRVDLAQTQVELGQCLERRFFEDVDGDGEEDSLDACPETPPGEAVDAAGCSADQFCAAVEGDSLFDLFLSCAASDWQNDEPRETRPGDCRLVRLGGLKFGCAAQ